MIKAAVLGSPISHSLSPLLHNSAYSFLHLQGHYESIEVKADELANFLARVGKVEWAGFSLTMPLKEFVIPLADSVEERSARITSANTLIFESGKSYAFSSDLLAFERLLADTNCERVAILGGGGTARAALGALDGRAKKIDILVRNDKRRSALQACVEKTEVELRDFHTPLVNYDLVISTVPVGAADSLVAAEFLPEGTLFEVLYHPWPTKLSSLWQSAGLPLFSGFQLLVEQALDQIRVMTQIDFDYGQMRAHLLNVVNLERSSDSI